MQFSDTTNKSGLIQDCELLLGFDDAAISGNTTLLKRFTSLLNLARRKAELIILQSAQPGWAWDDPNYAGSPRTAQDLSTSTNVYNLPVNTGSYSAAAAGTLLEVDKIAVLDSNGTERQLRLTDLSDSELNVLYATAGLPVVYKLDGTTAKVWPTAAAANVTATNGFIVYFRRVGKDFASSGDDTQTPGFAVPFHRFCSLQAAEDYASISPSLADRLPLIRDKRIEMISQMQDYYATRLNDGHPNRIRRKRTNYF